MIADAVSACPHCGTPVEGFGFCCPGCEIAHRIVTDAGLGAYYARRDALPDRPTPVRADWGAVPVAHRDGGCEAKLVVEGLRCTACVWVVERVLEQTDGVTQAHVSYATGRATLVWDPTRTSLPEIAGQIAALGYRPRPVDAAPTHDRDLLTRLGVAAFCAANVMLLTISVYAGWFDGMDIKYGALFRWTSLALSAPVALWAASPFFEGALRGLRHGVLHMDLPIALAVGALFAHGIGATIVGEDAYLDSLGMLVTLLLGGRVLEARGRRAAAASALALSSALPSTARRITPDGVETVGADRLQPGDHVEVGVGEEVPADGVVRGGRANVRMALVTGEAEPVTVGAGSHVVAGAPLVDGAVTVEVTQVGAETLGRRMAQEVAASVDRGLEATPADQLAPAFTAVTLLGAALTYAGWTWTSGPGEALRTTTAVLVVACPCALALSWPLAAAAGLGALGRRGLVLRSGDALLRLARVDAVALDKTGTVTEGVPVVVRAEDRVVRVAAALERGSTHPVARAILDEARARGIALPRATEVEEEPGVGVRGRLDGRSWELRAGEGPGEVALLRDGEVAGVLALRDVPRADAAATLARLGLPVTLLTGDHPHVAQRIAIEVGLVRVEARMRPLDKVSWLRARQDEGHEVLFVGDGLNDGPALTAANVGLAMGTGATSAVLAADGVVAGEGLGPVLSALRVSRVVRRVVEANLARSLAYNVVAVGLAAAGYVDPLVAAISMPLSSLLVIHGALRVETLVQREDSWTSSSS